MDVIFKGEKIENKTKVREWQFPEENIAEPQIPLPVDAANAVEVPI